MAKTGFFSRLKERLSKTHAQVTEKLEEAVSRIVGVDEDLFEEFEEILISADFGAETSLNLVDRVRTVAFERGKRSSKDVLAIVQEQLIEMLNSGAVEINTTTDKPPAVVLVIGVNGTGKTTTIGKLAYQYQKMGKKVILAAGDTFRSAAIEQLEVWAGRAGCDIIKHAPNSDPAAVIFDAIAAAKARGADIVLADTAGRLHTKVNLMEELKKIKRVVERAMPGQPQEILLVLDGTTGQNALSQAKLFGEAMDVTGIILTKLDGTAKGGIVIAIADQMSIPVKMIGVGEQIDDLQPFDPKEFVEALFS